MYEEVKKNIIEKFFNCIYKYTVVSSKKAIIDDINKRLPFKVISDKNCESISIDLGDNIFINFICLG